MDRFAGVDMEDHTAMDGFTRVDIAFAELDSDGQTLCMLVFCSFGTKALSNFVYIICTST